MAEFTQELETFLLTHRMVWAGWPTYEAQDDADLLSRVDRLTRGGFPITSTRQIKLVDTLIADIRKRERKAYVQAHSYGWAP